MKRRRKGKRRLRENSKKSRQRLSDSSKRMEIAPSSSPLTL